MMSKTESPQISKKDISLLPAGIRVLVDEKDPLIQAYVIHALRLRKMKAKRNG